MPFYPPSWMPKLASDPPDDVSIPDFMLDPKYGRYDINKSRPFFTCGLSGKTYTPSEVQDRVNLAMRGLAQEMGWLPDQGSEYDKVVGLWSVNTIDTVTLAWGVHHLGGIVSPANAQYSPSELEYQMKHSGAKCIFTCLPLLQTTVSVAQKLGIPTKHIYILDVPDQLVGGKKPPKEFKTLDDLIKIGKTAKQLAPLKLKSGEGASRTAFLCYSSGTSGLPKGVMISHRNVISNIIQLALVERNIRGRTLSPDDPTKWTKNALGVLPFSHIYGLVLICHLSLYMGDGIIVLPKFDMASFLDAIEKQKINQLYVVPPIIIQMVNNKQMLSKHDLSSVEILFTGAAPLGEETAEAYQKIYPNVIIQQGYGLTETCTVVSSSASHDLWLGSCGSILPGFEVKLMSIEGHEITGYDQPGELLAKSPSVVLGYLNNDKANAETFQDGYMRTGDEAVIRKSPNGYEHIFIVDRLKELIKVKGLQVAPAELEAHLLTHEAVADCAVIAVPDPDAGEVPKAFVVKSAKAGGIEDSPRILMRELRKHVEEHKARHKWLKGGVEFIDEIPKSPSGKILRRLLRDKEKERRQKAGSKL